MAENKTTFNTNFAWYDEDSTWTSPAATITATTITDSTNYAWLIPATYDGIATSSEFTITYSDPIPWNTSSVYTKQAGIISLVIFMCFLKDVIQFSKEQDIKLQELRIKTINDEILF